MIPPVAVSFGDLLVIVMALVSVSFHAGTFVAVKDKMDTLDKRVSRLEDKVFPVAD